MKIVEFGNSILRVKCTFLAKEDIKSVTTQQLIADMHDLLTSKKLGVGLAAPQVGATKAVAVISIQKTPLRFDVEEFSLTIINPVIRQVYGRRSQLWEGCISSGPGKAALFAKVPRYKKIELEYYDEQAVKHTTLFSGLNAHVIQHEVDHLNGVLFVDKVKDPTTYMTHKEYKKMKENR